MCRAEILFLARCQEITSPMCCHLSTNRGSRFNNSARNNNGGAGQSVSTSVTAVSHSLQPATPVTSFESLTTRDLSRTLGT